MPPYEELVYLLDLCIFSYQLHAQTLIWPMDPYYEQMVYYDQDEKELKDRRYLFMNYIKNNFLPPNHEYSRENTRHIYRGPGSLKQQGGNGWEDNPALDPIISDYRRIYPWRPGFTRPRRDKEPWIVYNTPTQITNRIKEVWMVQYSKDEGPKKINPTINQITKTAPLKDPRPASIRPPANEVWNDWLYCFEGGTGAIGNSSNAAEQNPCWSMMGFVLAVRNESAAGFLQSYDLYIVFRGSRSGKLRAGAFLKNKGNPDWVTDFDSMSIPANQKIDPVISPKGGLYRGFLTSIKTMLPTIMKCLTAIEDKSNHMPPTNIYVTGHSLGGALATLFTSAVKKGQYRPNLLPINGGMMPAQLWNWPWQGIQLVTYGSPTVGDLGFYDYYKWHIKGGARVAIWNDVITYGTNQVGEANTINKNDTQGVKLEMAQAHDPRYIRKYLIERIRRKAGGLNGQVPASAAGQPVGRQSDEPWRVFDTSSRVLSELVTAYPNLSECLTGFSSELETYLKILKNGILITSVPAQNEVQAIIAAITNNDWNTILQLTPVLTPLLNTTTSANPSQIAQILGDDMLKFLGICTIFAYISKNNIQQLAGLQALTADATVNTFLTYVY